jgi:glycosyltransferase involved in cell wall biosynthesis
VIRVALHADQAFAVAPGGIGTYLRELAPRLAARPDVEVTLFHARFDRPPPEDWMHRLPTRALGQPPTWLYPSWDLAGRPRLPAGLSGLEILHAPLPAAIPPPGPDQRLVVTVHDLAFRPHPRLFPPRWLALYRLGTRRAARRADAVIVPSESTARDLVRYERADRSRIHVIPLAGTLGTTEADPEEVLQRLRIPQPYLLFVGTLEPRKNLLRLVRAYRRMVTTAGLPHALVLAGPLGWQAHPLLRELRMPGPGEVALTGRLGPADLDALYRGADAFVYPSLYEGFGLPVLEAMVRGVPAVISSTSSLPEVAGDAAVQVDPRSVPAMAEALERLLRDPAEAARLGKAGAGRAEEFSWERTAEATVQAYRSALKRPPRGG